MMKKTLARKLTVKIALLLITALLILLIGSYHAVSHIVQTESADYNNAIAGTFVDLLTYEANGMHLPVDKNFTEFTELYGKYICQWYNVDYAYVYTVADDGGEILLLGYAEKDKETTDKSSPLGEIGTVVRHTPTPEEKSLWNGERDYAVMDSVQFDRCMESIARATDEYGNRIIVSVGIFLTKLDRTTAQNFKPVVLILLAAFIVMTGVMYFLIRRSVFKPAKQISESMAAFLTNGQRSHQKLDESGDDEFAMIAAAFNTMTDNIDTYLDDIHTLTGAQERQKTELDIAAKIQTGFLAPAQMGASHYEISAMMKAAKNIGGDLYDYVRLDDDRILLTIADVSGKGIAASLYMAVTLVLIRQFAKMGHSPDEILRMTNDTISENNPNMFFATAFVGIYDTQTGIFTYANAGHNPPYLLGDTPQPLDCAQNILIGLYKDETYQQAEIRLHPGEIVFLYTDGVNEATDAQSRFYGEERLIETLSAFRATHEENLVQYVYRSVCAFTKDAEQSDDITMLAFTVKQRQVLELTPDEREFSKIKAAILGSQLSRELQLSLCVAAEEIFINICRYAFADAASGTQTVRFTFEHFDRIVMRFEDSGTPYDPTQDMIDSADYDPDEQIGGLGKLIAFTIADDVTYTYTDHQNILTITKYMKEAGV